MPPVRGRWRRDEDRRWNGDRHGRWRRRIVRRRLERTVLALQASSIRIVTLQGEVAVVRPRGETAILPRALAHRLLAIARLESFRTIVRLVACVTDALLAIAFVAPTAFARRTGPAGCRAAMPSCLDDTNSGVRAQNRAV